MNHFQKGKIMSLADTINKADKLVTEAAAFHGLGKMEDCIGILLDLRDLMDEPISEDAPGEDNTSENCKLCGKPKIA